MLDRAREQLVKLFQAYRTLLGVKEGSPSAEGWRARGLDVAVPCKE